MRSRSRFAKRSSTRLAAVLLAATVLAALAGVVGAALGSRSVAAAGIVGAAVLAGVLAVYFVVTERRRHEVAEDELHAQTRSLELLVASIAEISRPLDRDEILDKACAEAKRVFGARRVRFLPPPPGMPEEPRVEEGRMLLPLAVRGEPIGAFELERPEPFARSDVFAATVLADFTSRAVENARLLAEAREREAERSRLAEQLVTAEQDERRRLSLSLHDGPLQTLSGVALMHDAALQALREGRYEDAQRVMAGALERERETIRTLRDLSFAIEPVVLRDEGFEAAVQALGDQLASSHGISVSAAVGAGERLGEKAQAALYQVVREALGQSVQRRSRHIEVRVVELEDGSFAAEVADDGMGERRRRSVEAIEERVRVLNGRLSLQTRDGEGTVLRVVLPAYVAASTE